MDQDERWLSLRTLDVVTPDVEQGVLTMGAMSFPPNAQVERDGDRLVVLHDGWRLERFIRYRPLVYFAVFGEPAAFACLRLALTSLFEFGGYDGDVLVLTDEAHLDLATGLPEAWRARIATRPLDAADMLDWTLARYRLVEMPEFSRYRPYLYLDIDVVANAGIALLLKRLAISEMLHAPAENAVMSPDQSYGAALFLADGLDLPREVRGFSTGLMGFPDIATVASLFTRVPRLALAYAQQAGRRDTFGCYDQPFANYAAIKTSRLELTLFDRFLDNRWYWYERLAERRGLTHFTGGTSHAAPKSEVMAAYLQHLRGAPSG